MASITGVLDLSQIPQDQFDPQFEFRAAVVRNGAVLGSATLTPRARARQISFQVSFEPPTLPSARLPCPVVLLVGPNVGDQELQSLETLRHEVDLRTAAQPSVPPRAEPSISAGCKYRRRSMRAGWSFAGPTRFTAGSSAGSGNTIRLPAAGVSAMPRCRAPSVEVYDVDCFLWWCWRGLITSADHRHQLATLRSPSAGAACYGDPGWRATGASTPISSDGFRACWLRPGSRCRQRRRRRILCSCSSSPRMPP